MSQSSEHGVVVVLFMRGVGKMENVGHSLSALARLDSRKQEVIVMPARGYWLSF